MSQVQPLSLVSIRPSDNDASVLPDDRACVFGVDFSGAKDAGKHIWIAKGTVDSPSQQPAVLRLEDCRSVDSLPGRAADLEPSLAALRDFVAGQPDATFGMDFPFGLPQVLLNDARWEDFVRTFPDRYQSADEFRSVCLKKAGGREVKRVTDIETRTPFSALHMRIYRQTYYGIRDVLSPLVRQDAVSVLPMQSAAPGRPCLVEICPASTLKRENIYLHYKHPTPECLQARRTILARIMELCPLTIEPQLQQVILGNWKGDALDSVIAAFATFRALQSQFHTNHDPSYALEGHIYT